MSVIKRPRKTKIVLGSIVLVELVAIGLWISVGQGGDSPEWGPKLHAALVDCDRIRVRSGGLCHRRSDSEVTIFEITGSADVEDVVRNIKIDSHRSGFHCMCCGDPTFEFYRNGDIVASVGFHHGISLRWRGWRGDGSLQPGSSEYLKNLLEEHGYHIADPAGDL